MGQISVTPEHLDHLLPAPASTCTHPFQRAFAELAASHCERPTAQIVPLPTRRSSASRAPTWPSRPRRSAAAPRTI
ncbi:hypothetical protein [Streptomyces sp. NPDC094032]|uniref:hypothetical protein n=1 Tax=Streptomyces sp. NPDC094032 TaxID=3155308 RepID=UPI00331EBC9D